MGIKKSVYYKITFVIFGKYVLYIFNFSVKRGKTLLTRLIFSFLNRYDDYERIIKLPHSKYLFS